MITPVIVSVICAALAVSPPGEAASPRVDWKAADGKVRAARVEVVGLTPQALAWLHKPERTLADWNAALAVQLVDKGADGSLCLIGRYAVVGDVVWFTPRYPLEPGLGYRAVLDLERLGAPHGVGRVAAEYRVSKAPSGPTARVAAIYPSSDVLPENLLRLYIQFSAPMSRGEAYRRVRLRDEKGRGIDAPFLELDEELWSTDQTRFTLLFDPGRIKRGLVPRRELGPALRAGSVYTIEVDAAWEDAQGRALAAGAVKRFRVGPADETSPDPATWRIDAPRAGGAEPLVVQFPEPLDHALLERMLTIRDAAGAILDGTAAVDAGERGWRWRPRKPWSWKSGDYRIVIDVELEDAAGNSVARPFEVDETTPITARTTVKTRALPFRIPPRGP